MRQRRKPLADTPQGAPAWMTTYGDLVTQILAFFVLLYSFSSLNEQKFRQTIVSLQGAFGVMPGATDGTAGTNKNDTISKEDKAPVQADPIKNSVKDAQLAKLANQVERLLRDEGLEREVQIRLEDKALTLHFSAQALFDSGQAVIKPGAENALDVVASFLRSIPNEVRIEGHTDSDPISTPQYPSNWQLSADRAASVLRYLQDFGRIRADRMSISGYADFRPVAPNDTPINKAKNRRVDVVVLSLTQ